MSLNDVYATLSTDGSTRIILTHRPTQVALQDLLLIRATPEHRNFILGTWVKSYRPHARKQGIGEFYDKHEGEVAESRWQDCWVASDEDGFTVYAWVCAEGRNLYHVYVIPELRRKGVSGALIQFSTGQAHPDMARPWPFTSAKLGRVDPYLLHKKESHNA